MISLPEQPGDKHPSQIFLENLEKQWGEDPAKFVDNIWDHVDPFDKMGNGPQYVHQLIESGKIPADKFDDAAVQWLSGIDIPKIAEDFRNPEKKGIFPTNYKLLHLLHVVMPNRRGETKFPKAVEWFRAHREDLLAVSITDDGGHWENGLKRILREYL